MCSFQFSSSVSVTVLGYAPKRFKTNSKVYALGKEEKKPLRVQTAGWKAVMIYKPSLTTLTPRKHGINCG